MADEEKKIFVDDDWKAQARAEKERLAQETEAADGGGEMPDANFVELINMMMMQALVGLGVMASPDGQRIPPNLPVAKHFIDLLQVLSDKTKGNLSDEEQRMLDQVLYELRMRYVEMTSGGGGPAAGPAGAGPAPTAG